jgi:hypothetical protein
MVMVITISTINYCILQILLIENSCKSTYLRQVGFSKYIILNKLHKSEKNIIIIIRELKSETNKKC